MSKLIEQEAFSQNNLEVSKIEGVINYYEGASLLKITEEEQKELLAPFDENLIEIRPDGLIYLPQTFWRGRLNSAFGIGQWALIVKGNHKDPAANKDKLYLNGVLMIRGNYVSEAIGEAELHSSNPMQSWASVWESAKSDCITRNCKDLGIASELWQPTFINNWIAKHAVKVWREKTGKKKDGSSGSFQWRKKTAPKFYDEKDFSNNGKTESKPVSGSTGSYKDDNREWLSEANYNAAVKRIQAGEDIFDKLKEKYKISKKYYAGLMDAKNYKQKTVTKLEDEKPIDLPDLVKENISKCETMHQLNELWDRQNDLHNNKTFIKLVTEKKKELSKPVK